MSDSRGWNPIETAPNNVFDVLAKYYDASLDRFLYRRFADCVLVNGQIVYGTPGKEAIPLTDAGFKPMFWRDIPELPDEAKSSP